MANPTSDWERLGDSFYSKTRLYDAVFDHDLELQDVIITGAPYAGAIALYPDQERVHTYRNNQPTHSSIDIYSCAGHLVRRLNWDQSLIRGLGWSRDETLIIVSEKGVVRCYRDLEADFSQFTLGHEAEQHGVKACKFWTDGFVAILFNDSFIAVSHYSEPRPRKLASLPAGVVHSWTVVAPAYSLSRSVEIYVAIDQTVYVVDANEAEDRVLPNGPFVHIVASPNGLYLALYTGQGQIWIITSDFQQKLGEYESQSKTNPKDVQWCGNDAVLLAWEDEVQVIGPNGASLKFFYDDWVHLIPDVDGVRLLTNDVCEFLQKVADPSESVFRLGSTSPASVLFDAAQQLDEGSPRADENIQLIRNDLADAVASCVSAAAQQYHIQLQKQLLKAASFGKSVLDLYSSDDFVEVCRDLRVLNAVRDHRIGLPITYRQYKELSPEKLIFRLVNRHEYQLCIHLSNILKCPTHHIYLHWASHKVRASQSSDEAICTAVVNRLRHKRGISFEKLARVAFEEGRNELSKALLNQETRAGKQVPLLMSMSEDEFALEKAIASGDTDLVYHVLLHLKKTLPLAAFFRTVTKQPMAVALVESSARLQDQTLLKDFYHQDDRRLDQASLLFSEALTQTLPQAKVDKLKLSTTHLGDNSKDAQASQTLRTTQETQSLLRLQASLDRDLDPSTQQPYIGMSLNQTIFYLLLHGQHKKAQKLSQDLHVSPRAFEWIRVRALVGARNWQDLEDHAHKTKRSLIGWEAYFNEILSAGNTKLAGKYVYKCISLPVRERSEMFMKCGMPQQAGEELAKAKDLEGLEDLKERAGTNSRLELERIIAGLKIGK